MSNPLFPTLTGLKWNRPKRPIFNTTSDQTASGAEFRSTNQQYAIHEFDLAVEYMSKTDETNLEALFKTCQGGFAPFYFDAVNDDTIPAGSPVAIGVGDGSNKIFSLYQSVGTYLEPAGGNSNNWGIVPGTNNVVYDNGTPVASANYSASDGGFGATITFVTAPAAGHVITWTGVYYYLCRFKDDQMDLNQFMNLMYESKGFTLRTVR